MALYHETYTISRARTGDAKIKDLVLTGWSNDPTATGGRKSLEAGRCYYKVTAADVLDIYNAEDTANAIKIMTGPIDPDTDIVTLAAATASGISGSCIVEHTPGTAATGEIIVTYAFESDLRKHVSSLDGLLDGNDKWEGQDRFQAALIEAKELIDEALIAKISNLLDIKASGKVDLAGVASPRQLAKAHAMKTAAVLLFNHAVVDPDVLEVAQTLDSRGDKALKLVSLDLDTGNDDQIIISKSLSGSKITRA